jgi:TatD DNase family protein
MNWIDTHTHLYLDQFEKDIDEVVENAMSNGVNKMLLPAIEKGTHQSMMSLVEKWPDQFHPMIGLHPCSVKENFQEELDFVRQELANSKKYVAIGEIGIDLYWDTSFFKEQVEAFKQQIAWSKEFDLPIVIHARNSFREIFEVLEEVNDDRLHGVFHCFTGGKKHAKKAIEMGFKLGVGGVVTFDQGLPNVIKKVDLEHLILETDSPFLSPLPHKGERNESAYVPYVGTKIAELMGLSVEEVARRTTENAINLFKL